MGTTEQRFPEGQGQEGEMGKQGQTYGDGWKLDFWW